MEYTQAEILQTVAMTEMEHLDVRTVTLGLNLLDCTSDSMAGVAQKAVALFEITEAFAGQVLACIKELDLDVDKLNVTGGAIALGHPLGCSGARILTTLVHEMQRREEARYGLATMCIGVGQGIALAIERV